MDLVWSPTRGLTVVGPNTTAFLAALPAGSSALGVRLHRAVRHRYSECPPRLRDAGVATDELWRDDGKRLEQSMEAASEPGPQRALLMAWLGQRAHAALAPDPLVRATARRLSAAPQTRVTWLARELGMTERLLHRRVVSQVGYGPKRLGRVLRLRRALDDARAGCGLAEAAFGAPVRRPGPFHQ